MTRPGAGRWLDVPEVHVAIFSFLLHLVWEFLRVPLSPTCPPPATGRGRAQWRTPGT
jgi:hypothetical protein